MGRDLPGLRPAPAFEAGAAHGESPAGDGASTAARRLRGQTMSDPRPLSAADLLNSLGIAGPNIRHSISSRYPKPVPGLYVTFDDDRECVCGRVWPCEALQLAELVALPDAHPEADLAKLM